MMRFSIQVLACGTEHVAVVTGPGFVSKFPLANPEHADDLLGLLHLAFAAGQRNVLDVTRDMLKNGKL